MISDYCFLFGANQGIDTASVERLLRQTDNINELEWFSGFGTDTFGPPGIYFERDNALPASCQEQVIALDGTDSITFDATELFSMYEQIFAEYYVDFERSNVDWTSVAQAAGMVLNNNSTAAELFTAMGSTLEPLADGHNFVQAPQGWSAKTLTKQTLIERLIEESANMNGLPYPIPQDMITQQIVDDVNAYVIGHLQNQWEMVTDYAGSPSDIKSAADGLIRWFENESVGYLYIGSMSGYAENTEDDELLFTQQTLANMESALDLALTDLADVEGLIVDVRTNDGGFDFISLAIASRFTQTEFHAYSKQARNGASRTQLRDVYLAPRSDINYVGPVALLTSTSTVSAAETFTMTMSQLPQVTVIGEASHGALSNVMEWALPNGFQIGLSNEYYLSPEGEWYEGTGIPVDIEVPFYTPQQRDNNVDLGIETAIGLFLE